MGDYNELPDFQLIRQTRGRVARGRKCTRCGKLMPQGTPFEATIYRLDGEFRSDFECLPVGPEYGCAVEPPTPTETEGA